MTGDGKSEAEDQAQAQEPTAEPEPVTEPEPMAEPESAVQQELDAESEPSAMAQEASRPFERVMAFGEHHLGRRQVLFGLGAIVLGGLEAARRLGDLGTPTGSPSPGTQGTPSPQASPAASPIVSPGATPIAPPSASGPLQIVREQRPGYAGQPVESEKLSVLIDQTDNSDFSPVAFNQSFQIMASYLDPLIWIDDVTMEPQPWLAEKWEWSSDGKTLTYTLRSDVKWHDGQPLAAKDVVFSLFVARDDVNSNVSNFFTTMTNALAVDDRTVRITLSEPDGGWILNASNQFIFYRAQYADYWYSRPEGERTLSGFDWSKTTPIGTGPWKITKIDKGDIQFARNDSYFAGPPHFSSMTISWEPDANKRLQAWQQGTTDLLWPTRPQDVATVENDAGRLYVADAASVMFAAFNFQNPSRADAKLFDDVRIRQAFSLAIDRQGYGDQVFAGFLQADKAGTVAQPWAHDDSIVNPKRDLKQARQLLSELGWEDRNGDGILDNPVGNSMELSLIVRNDSRAELLALLKSVATDLGELGIKLDVEVLPPDQFRDRWVNKHDFDLIAYAYNLYAGFTDFDLYGSAWDIRTNPQGWNPGAYHNKQVDAAINVILGAEDLTKQRAALVQLQQDTNTDLFGLWFGFPQDLVLVRPDIQGFQPNKLWQTWNTRLLWRG